MLKKAINAFLSKSLIVEEQCNINKIYKYKSAVLFISFLCKHGVFSSSDDNQQKLWLAAKELGILLCNEQSATKSVNCLEGFWQFNKGNNQLD